MQLGELEIPVEVTKNFEFLMELPRRVRTAVLEGSTRSSKTISILQWLCLKCLRSEKKIIIRCFRQDGVTHKDTTIPDFFFVMGEEMLDAWDFGKWNATDKKYTFPNGSEMNFSACKERDGSQKLHGLKQDIAWLNEVMEIDYDAYTQISYRTTDLIIMDFNPSFNHHWVFDKIIPLPTTRKSHSTYKDNPFLSPFQVADIEKYNPNEPENVRLGTADAWKWAVYGEGQRGKIEGAIFPLARSVNWFPERRHAQYWGYGLDFGFTTDPTALIECALLNDELYLREAVYQHGLLATPNQSQPGFPNLVSHMEADLDFEKPELGQLVDKNSKIIADSAAPAAIADLHAHGYNIKGVKKTKGKEKSSIIRGINIMKKYRINIHEHSVRLMTEFEHYIWGKKGNGIATGMPDETCEDHGIDAARYWCMDVIGDITPSKQATSSNTNVKSRVRGRASAANRRQKQKHNQRNAIR